MKKGFGGHTLYAVTESIELFLASGSFMKITLNFTIYLTKQMFREALFYNQKL